MIRVQRQSDKKTPFRLKYRGFTVSVHTKDEAKRVKKFIHKILKDKSYISFPSSERANGRH